MASLKPHMGILENVVGLRGQDGWEQSSDAETSTPLDLVLRELRKERYWASHIEVDLGTFHDVVRKRCASSLLALQVAVVAFAASVVSRNHRPASVY